MKKLLACFLVLCLALGLCACGGTPAASEPAKTEPGKSEPAKTEPAKTEPAKTEPAKTDPPETAPVWTEPAERVRWNDALIESFVELWSYEDSAGYVHIYPDWTWDRLDEDGLLVDSGKCSYLEGYGLILEQTDGTDWDYLFFGDDGALYNSASMRMSMAELDEPIDDQTDNTRYFYEEASGAGYSALVLQLYEELYSKIVNLEDFSYSLADYDEEYLYAVNEASYLVYLRHPETRIYYELGSLTEGQDGLELYSIYSFEGDYSVDNQFIQQNMDDFENRLVKAAAKIETDPDMTAYELYLKLASFVASNADLVSGTIAGASSSPWAGIMGGNCTDEGYAAALLLLCREANLYCELVRGYSNGEFHTWNLVKLPSGTYYIDLAWAETVGAPQSPEWMAYFMMNHTQILEEYEFLD